MLEKPLQLRTEDEDRLCAPGGRLNYPTKDMAAIFIDSCAELPGLAVAAVAIDLVGRKL